MSKTKPRLFKGEEDGTNLPAKSGLWGPKEKRGKTVASGNWPGSRETTAGEGREGFWRSVNFQKKGGKKTNNKNRKEAVLF